jgi:acyl-CoA thioesterase
VACNTYNEVTIGLGCSIDYIAPALRNDTLVAICVEKSRGGRTGNYDVRVENQNGKLIALFHGKSYKVKGSVLAPENPDD